MFHMGKCLQKVQQFVEMFAICGGQITGNGRAPALEVIHERRNSLQ